MIERIIASNNGTETPEDLYERVKREHPFIYETVSTFIPEGWQDAPKSKAD